MKDKLLECIDLIFGMRKFILMLILYTVGIIFRVTGLLAGAEMVDLFKATTIAFMGSNGVEHLCNTVKEYVSSKASTIVNTKVSDVVSETVEKIGESQ